MLSRSKVQISTRYTGTFQQELVGHSAKKCRTLLKRCSSSHTSQSSPPSLPRTLTHSLVDVQSCRESNYEILADPTTAGGLYTRALQVDDSGKQLLVDIARDVGSCSTCTGNGDLRQGFRAEVRGMVITLADGEIPPTIAVTGAIFSDGTATACDGSEPLTPSTTGGSSGGDSSNVDKLGNESDENDAAINVVSSISVVCILLVALISMFKGTFQRK